MKNILIATYPFGLCGKDSVKILEKTGWSIHYNYLGRRLNGDEVRNMLIKMDGVIAGTEPYNKETIKNAKNLKVISRVGVGLDNIDFNECERKGIVVTYTPEAPADGVADLAVAQILNLIRGIISSDKSIREGRWNRFLGLLVSEIKIGVFGVGRIGSRVINRLRCFGSNPIYACDLFPINNMEGVVWMSKEELFLSCDLVTIHIPLNKENYHCVGLYEMGSMKSGSFIVNTSRGSIVDEKALESLIYNKHLGGAALDVFEKEPYNGIFTKFDNIILTAHIAASTKHTRFMMEYEAAEDCIRVLSGLKPLRLASGI